MFSNNGRRQTKTYNLYTTVAPDESGLVVLDRSTRKRLVKVLRLGIGDSLNLYSHGRRWECSILRIEPDAIVLQTLQELPTPALPAVPIVVAQAITKGEKFEWWIQKSTELGVSEIIPLITQRTIVRPEKEDEKLQRWNEIAEHAASQSESGYIPQIYPAQTLHHFIKLAHQEWRIYMHEREEASSLKAALKSYAGGRMIVVVGPEGGWSADESASLTAAGFHKVHLGNRILRAETASLAVVSILQYEVGDFS